MARDPTLQESVLSFYNIDTLGAALRASQWTVDREIAFLVDLIETNKATDGYLALAAHKQFRATLTQYLRYSGILTKVRAESLSDGNQRLVAEHMRLARAANEAGLLAAETVAAESLYSHEPKRIANQLIYEETETTGEDTE